MSNYADRLDSILDQTSSSLDQQQHRLRPDSHLRSLSPAGGDDFSNDGDDEGQVD